MSRQLHARMVTLCATLVSEMLSESLAMHYRLANNGTGDDALAALDAAGMSYLVAVCIESYVLEVETGILGCECT